MLWVGMSMVFLLGALGVYLVYKQPETSDPNDPNYIEGEWFLKIASF
jgi:hypothetical protein